MSRVASAVIVWAIQSCFYVAAQNGPEPRDSISGIVINAATGQPIPGAQVILRVSYSAYGFADRQADRPLPADTTRVATDEAGHFTIGFDPVIPPTRLFVSRDGFRSEDNRDFANVLLRSRLARNLTIKLTPQSIIAGRVTNREGEPVKGILVQAIRVDVKDGRRELVRNYELAVTDDDGGYRLRSLPPGSYYMQAIGRGAKEDEAYGPVYFPEATDWRAAQEVRLGAGATVAANFTLAAHKAYRIRGTLLNVEPRRRVLVRLMHGGEPMANRGVVKSDSGLFEVEAVAPGAYVVQAYTPDMIPADYGEASVTVVDHDVDGVKIAMSSTPDVRGKIEFSGVRDAGRFATITATPASNYQPALTIATPKAVMAADGSFVLRNLLPGQYDIAVKTAPNYYVESILAGAVDVQALGLTVSPGKAPDLKVTIRRGGCEIEGEIEGGDEPVTVVLVRRPAENRIATVANTVRGQFLAVSLPPGDYTVYAIPADAPIDYKNPDSLEAFSDYAARVHVNDGAREHITVRVAPTP